METKLSSQLTDLQLTKKVSSVEPGTTLTTEDARHFELIKHLLLKHKRVGIRVCLLDQDGYIIRQASSRVRADQIGREFDDRQKTVLKALERVLGHCREQGISLVGYSDQLVAVPSVLLHSEFASESAREIKDQGVYTGADNLRTPEPER